MGKMYHFVHLAEHFVVVQWSGRHVERMARTGSKIMEIGGQETLLGCEDITARFDTAGDLDLTRFGNLILFYFYSYIPL